MHPFVSALAGLALSSLSARAEFVLQAPPPPPPIATPPADPAPRVHTRRVHPVVSKQQIAEGFGHRIPLAIALEQILPPESKVEFGPGVDEQRPVDWTGGRPWQEVVRATLRPLGLRSTLAGNKVKVEAVEADE